MLQRFLLRLKFEDAVKFLKSLKNSGDCDETEIGRMLVRQAERIEISEKLMEVGFFKLLWLRENHVCHRKAQVEWLQL